MRRRLAIPIKPLAVAAAALLALVACGGQGTTAGSGSATANNKPLTKFTSAVFQSELYLPDFVAKDKGFDAAHGIDMNFVTPSNGAAAAQLMLAGQVQGWFTDPLIVLTAAAKGQDIKMAGLSVPDLEYWLLVSKQGNWPPDSASFQEKMQALKGKTIGVSGIGAGTDHALLAGLAAAGLSANDVHRVGIGQQQAAIGQLQAGRIDGFVSFSLAGNAIIEQQAGARLFVSYADRSVPEQVRNVPDGALAVSGSFASQHPDVIKNWIAAEQEALDWIKKHQDDAAKILNEHVYSGQQLDLAKKVMPQLLKGPFANPPAGFKVPRASFDLAVKTLKDLAIVPTSTSVTYEDVVIPSGRE